MRVNVIRNLNYNKLCVPKEQKPAEQTTEPVAISETNFKGVNLIKPAKRVGLFAMAIVFEPLLRNLVIMDPAPQKMSLRQLWKLSGVELNIQKESDKT